jgi:hypothetical protein
MFQHFFSFLTAFTNDIERDPDAKSTDPFFLFHNYPKDSVINICKHTHTHTHTHTHMVCVSVYIYLYMYTYIHTYI